jgi:3-oxoacyl-[acyl-carrier protein] reductase
MDLGLQGKVVLVTGGSRGIGRAIAIQCAAEGARVAICARTEEGLRSTLEVLQNQGTHVFGHIADVTKSDEVARFFQATAQTLGGIDILIDNVGGSQGKGLIGSTDEEWMRSFDLNVFHAVRTSRAVVPYMQQRGGGSIVIISSISGYKPSPSIQYGSAKAAEIFFSSALALELGPLQIRINTVCPGSTLFPGGGWERFQQRHPEAFQQFQREEFPFGRLASPEEIARVVAFVASPAGSWIHGAMIPVDGGQQQPSVFQRGPIWK